MENSGKPHRFKHGGSEKGAAASDKAESRRMHDQSQGQGSRAAGGQQGKKNQGGPYKASPKKGGFGPLSYSPGGLRGGLSPSQREDARWFSDPDNSSGGQEDHWRTFSQQPWRSMQGSKEDREQKSGKRWRNNWRVKEKRAFAEENANLVIEESKLSVKELQSLRQAEKRLKKDEVYSLTKKSRSNPGALYACALCDFLLDSLSDAYRHIRDRRHKKRVREKQEEAMLTEIPPPGPEQVSAVTSALEAVMQEHGIKDQDVENRRSAVSIMQELLQSVLPDVKLRLYGSSCTKFGFKDSDVNIDIEYPPHMHQPDVLLVVKESLSTCPLFVNLEADFHARVPVVICKEKKSGLICKVSAGNENAVQTTCYLLALSSREPVLLPLVLGLRRWARICEVDNPEVGGLPPYVFALMVIYFLQKRKEPLLPTYLNSEVKGFSLSRLSGFNLTHAEDGFVHWTFTPSSKEPSQPAERSSTKGKVPLVFPAPRPTEEAGRLWVELLRFYSLEFNMADNVISVRTGTVLSREMKDWPKKRIAVEDPFAVKRNVARSVNSQQTCDYILHCLKTTYKYFASPLSLPSANHKKEAKKESAPDLDDELLDLSSFSLLTLQSLNASQQYETQNDPDDSDCIIEEEVEGSDSDEEGQKEKVDMGKSSLSEEEEDEEAERRRQHLDSFTTEEEEIFPLDELSGEELLSDEEGSINGTPASMDEEEEEVELAPVRSSSPPVQETVKDECPENKHQKQLVYKFTRQAFTRGKSHIVVCSLCKRDGHLKKDCPEDFKKVELHPLPPLTSDFLYVLDRVCEQCYRDFAPDELELSIRELILQQLETFVRRQFAGAQLQLFGSSKNGFGFKKSDLDICMVLEGQESIDDVDCIKIIESLARCLKKNPGLRNILPITTAKVPIVKFYHISTSLEGDISLYNTLALHNTHLLASYAAIDRRVKILCYVMKVFAKMCDIGDASRGSLSSYAYTLMVLFFLQQRNPPVIPVLQEIYFGRKKPEVLVDGWNVYFFDDLKALPSHWPHHGKNTESIGELWLGLLRFYTEDFDFKEHVVSIRQQARLTTFSKQWTSKYIVIEDPFDLNHNLGAGLSRKMTNFIMKAFINGRTVFGTPFQVLPSIYPSHMEYFFDPEVLTEGQVAPNDRCCRICGKVGHFMKDCSMRQKSRPRRDSEKRLENQQENMDGDESRDVFRKRNEHHRKRDPLEQRCCFLCGSAAHIKKDCQLYNNTAGRLKKESGSPASSAHLKNLREKEKQGLVTQDEKKRKPKHVVLSPQAESLQKRELTTAPKKNQATIDTEEIRKRLQELIAHITEIKDGIAPFLQPVEEFRGLGVNE
ncbi:terminal uridylyltransferase 7 isoform X2 [Oryzias melastigma]|uniref:terminal uridylyltransferase 7 isoform X2 n=1 Tax=Oryzias melastigma TaxID=30732 RepID=UPI000CF7FB84|nr:terminal uridylyltransferase 7 isoform X2 [Oryzias melastigma]